MEEKKKLKVIGWREWLSLPKLGIRHIKAKVDTGARSSSLHAFDIETFHADGKQLVRFTVHPRQRNDDLSMEAVAEVFDIRPVRSSSGQSSERIVIVTPIMLMGETWPIELTLANRDKMGFRMLLGREAFRGHMLVDAGASYYSKKHRRKRRRKPQ